MIGKSTINRLSDGIDHAVNTYIDWTRRHFVPDWVYKTWLRAEMIDAETYRQFQERGFIDDETPPEYVYTAAYDYSEGQK